MLKGILFFSTLTIFFGMLCSCNSISDQSSKTFSEIALQQSVHPVRPGKPGKTPFWNKYAKRFIYAPAFNFDKIDQADKYRYNILSLKDSSTYDFESDVPYAPLSPVWAKIPVGYFKIGVVGLSAQGDSIGLAGKGQYYRASPYAPEDSVYHKPVMPYDSSAMVALDSLLHKNYVDYWLTHKAPDPGYKNYRYPAKIWSALIVGAVTYAELTSNTEEAKRATKIAVIVANHLLKISFPKGWVWEFCPPTYYGNWITSRKSRTFMRLDNSMPVYARRAGNAYLALYSLTDDKKYLNAAKRIGQTYKSTQMENGTWHLYANPQTGNATADSNNVAIPIQVVMYLDRLQKEYNMESLEGTIQKALKWIMQNPVKTFKWQGQFEDVGTHVPYKDLSREQACYLAIYLFKHHENMKLAKELVRFAEDQFVIWENPRKIISGKNRSKGFVSTNWITPSVQEQYTFWKPVTRSAGIMIKTYWYAYATTKKKIYLAKAKSIANALTLVQKAHDGNYPAFFTKYPMPRWLNGVVYPAEAMMNLENNLRALKSDK